MKIMVKKLSKNGGMMNLHVSLKCFKNILNNNYLFDMPFT